MPHTTVGPRDHCWHRAWHTLERPHPRTMASRSTPLVATARAYPPYQSQCTMDNTLVSTLPPH
eukprot:1438396-Prorocentrum_lima.AAC.1